MSIEMGLWLKRGVAGVNQLAYRYLKKRGFTDKLIEETSIGIWRPPLQKAPDSDFCRRFGSHGERLKGRLSIPLYSPTRKVIGLDTREVGKKDVLGYRMPASKWNPVWVSHTKEPWTRIRKGGQVFLVEGVFDLSALHWVVSDRDVIFSTMRAGMSKLQYEYLKRYCKGGVLIVYDNDEAGKTASDIAVHKLKKMRVPLVSSCSYIGKDPGEIWLKYGEKGITKSFFQYTLF